MYSNFMVDLSWFFYFYLGGMQRRGRPKAFDLTAKQTFWWSNTGLQIMRFQTSTLRTNTMFVSVFSHLVPCAPCVAFEE